jgi:hypothetical protein
MGIIPCTVMHVVSPMHAFAHALAHVLKMTYQADYEAGVRRHTDRLLLRRALADSSIDQNKTRTEEPLAPQEGREEGQMPRVPAR